MRILLSNDDGIHSPCLRALHRALCDAGHTLDVVAPLVEQSGVGCSVTLHSPLRLHPIEEEGFSGTAVAGTPVDCVKIALTTLLPEPPDLVVVGINNGANKGVDVFYSGTVGAATEAALRGLPAVAFSRPRPELEPPQSLARHAASLVDAVDWSRCAGKVLNVSTIPAAGSPRSGASGPRAWPTPAGTRTTNAAKTPPGVPIGGSRTF